MRRMRRREKRAVLTGRNGVVLPGVMIEKLLWPNKAAGESGARGMLRDTRKVTSRLMTRFLGQKTCLSMLLCSTAAYVTVCSYLYLAVG